MTVRELVASFQGWNARHRAPKTVLFYASRLKRFLAKFSDRDAAGLTSLELDEFLHAAGQGQSDSTRHHNAVAITSLQSFALREGLLEKPWTKKIEKPPITRRERIPTADEIQRLLRDASPEFRRIYRALSQSGARPGELCKLRIEQIQWDKHRIELKEHKTARKTAAGSGPRPTGPGGGEPHARPPEAPRSHGAASSACSIWSPTRSKKSRPVSRCTSPIVV